MLEKIKQYNKEKKLWKKHGSVIRDADRMLEIYNICQTCPLFGRAGGVVPGYDACTHCGCNLHPSKKQLNKIAWNTTRCPKEDPEWIEDIDIKKEGN